MKTNSIVPGGSSRNSTVKDNFPVLCKELPYNATHTPQTKAHYGRNILHQFYHIRISSHVIDDGMPIFSMSSLPGDLGWMR